jgi:hypothetical protein
LHADESDRHANRPTVVNLLVALLAPIVAGTGPSPQVGRLFPTVEAIVGNSNAVYAGQIAKMETVSVEYGRHTTRFTVKVSETLKGPEQSTLEFVCKPLIPDAELRKFMDKKAPFLWVSPPKDANMRSNLFSKMAHDHEAQPEYAWFRLYEEGSMDHYVDYDSNVFTADFRVISRWDDLLVEARRAARLYPKTVELQSLYVPHSVALMCGDKNAFGVLSVPKGKELEELARRLIQDPARVIADARKRSRKVYREPKPTELELSALKKLGQILLKDE